jgi:vitamin B12 transporter
MTPIRTTTAVCVLLAAAVAVGEGTPVYHLPPIITYGTPVVEPSTEAASVSVVDSTALRRWHDPSVLGALTYVTGIDARCYGPGQPVTVALRGSSGEQVAVFLDGRLLNSPRDGLSDLSLYGASGFERVVVVRSGYLSSVPYARPGGVVELRSRTPDGPVRLEIGTSVGSYGEMRGELALEGNTRGVRWRLEGERYAADNDYEYSYIDAFTSIEDSTRDNADVQRDRAALTLAFGERYMHKLRLSSASAERGVPGPVYWLTPDARQGDRRFSVDWTTATSFGEGRHVAELKGWFMRERLSYTSPDPFYPVDDRHTILRGGVGTRHRFLIADCLSASASWDARRDELESTATGEHDENSGELGLGLDVKVPVSESNGAFISLFPSMGVALRTGDKTRVHPQLGAAASIGRSVVFSAKGNVGMFSRAPTINERFWPEDAFSRGNTDLLPETAVSYDLGFVIADGMDRWSVSAVRFGQDADNLIAWGLDDNFVYTPLNIGKTEIRGWEFEGTVRPLRDMIKAQAGYMITDAFDTSDPDEEIRLIGRPESKAFADVSVQWRMLSAGMRANHVGERMANAVNTDTLASYTTVDARVGATLTLSKLTWDVTAALVNLTDERVEWMRGYPLPGRTWRVGLRASFAP